MDDAASAPSEHIMLSQFEVKQALPLADGTAAGLRPQWNVDKRSIVLERVRRSARSSVALTSMVSVCASPGRSTVQQGRVDLTRALRSHKGAHSKPTLRFLSERSGSPWTGLVRPTELASERLDGDQPRFMPMATQVISSLQARGGSRLVREGREARRPSPANFAD